MYVPFWMFNGRVFIDGDYIAYDESEDSDGNTHKSARFSVQRKGYLDYEKVPADALKAYGRQSHGFGRAISAGGTERFFPHLSPGISCGTV